MSTHTPGPWGIHSEAANAASGSPVHSEVRGGNYVVVRLGALHTDSAKANARLIAAAPDLLKALKVLVALYGEDSVSMDNARAAIAKAEGTP